MMKTRILICNKFYYRRGGDCIHTLALESLLRSQGHEVAVFAMKHTENLPSPDSDHWPGEIDFAGVKSSRIRAACRVLGLDDTAARFRDILESFRPDTVIFANIHSYLSPAIVREAYRAGKQVYWILHDYKLICPAYTCTRSGNECLDCLREPLSVVRNRCMKGSLAASVMGLAESLRWPRHKLMRWVDRFICPSDFMRRKMLTAGFPADKLRTVHNFSASLPQDVSDSRQPYYCYIGRLSPEKGIVTLLKAASRCHEHTLYIAGSGELEENLRKEYGNCKHIHFLGQIEANEVMRLLGNAHMSVVPSECCENNPLSLIESLCAGTPVIGSDAGGIPELIGPDCGTIYPSGDCEALENAIHSMFSRSFPHTDIARDACARFSPLAYYAALGL